MEPTQPLRREHIWCAIPVFNNADTVEQVARTCREYLQHVVVVDDGSTDTDVPVLFQGTDIVVLSHHGNRGKGHAILTALQYIEARGGAFAITIDADGQHCPKDIEKFIPLLQKQDEPLLVVGCRTFPAENVPAGSRFGRWFSNFWMTLETRLAISDCQSGFRAYPVRYISKMHLRGSRYEFETEILTKAAWAGIQIRTVDVDVIYPEPGSRITHFRPFLDNLRISLTHAKLLGRRLLPIRHRRVVPKSEDSVSPGMFLHPVQLVRKLLREDATPTGLGTASAVGIFLAVLPLIGIHTLVILYVAARLHLNKIVAVAVQNLAMPPFLPILCIEIGHYMLRGRWLTDITWEVVAQELPERLLEWLLGSLIVAPLAAVAVGVTVFTLARRLQRSLR